MNLTLELETLVVEFAIELGLAVLEFELEPLTEEMILLEVAVGNVVEFVVE